MGTLATARTATRRWLDETDSSNTNFDDSELNDYINQAVRKIAIELEWPLAKATATTVADQLVYTLPDNFLFLTAVFLDDEKIDVLDQGDMNALFPNWRTDDSGEPIRAFKYDTNAIALHKKPSSSFANLTILAEYAKHPDTLDDDADVPDLFEVAQDLIGFWAAGLGMLRAGNYKAMGVLQGLFRTELISIKPKLIKYSEEHLAMRWAE